MAMSVVVVRRMGMRVARSIGVGVDMLMGMGIMGVGVVVRPPLPQ